MKEYKINQKTLDLLGNYLSNLPWKQVNPFIIALENLPEIECPVGDLPPSPNEENKNDGRKSEAKK